MIGGWLAGWLEARMLSPCCNSCGKGQPLANPQHAACHSLLRVQRLAPRLCPPRPLAQNFFRAYPKLAGMTGTAATESAEFSQARPLVAA